MKFEDFLSNFSMTEICHFDPKYVSETMLVAKKLPKLPKWHTFDIPSEWVKGKTAGGCDNFPGFCLFYIE